MRSLVLIAGCFLLCFNPAKAEAQIYAASFGTKTVNWIELTNITWTEDPAGSYEFFQAIGVMRNYAGGPGWNFGPTAWNDVSLTESWYVAWRTYAHGVCLAPGWYYSGGAHRLIPQSGNVITHPNSPTYGGIYNSPCSA